VFPLTRVPDSTGPDTVANCSVGAGVSAVPAPSSASVTSSVTASPAAWNPESAAIDTSGPSPSTCSVAAFVPAFPSTSCALTSYPSVVAVFASDPVPIVHVYVFPPAAVHAPPPPPVTTACTLVAFTPAPASVTVTLTCAPGPIL